MGIEGVHQEGPYERVISAQGAAQQLPELLARVRDQREDYLITDEEGKTLGMLVNAQEFEELGEFLSLARNAYGRLHGETPVAHAEFAQEMGLEPADTDSMRQRPGSTP
ncbi:hypothetical protein [Streptomyces daliensis]|uniref:Antitoxin n=1 Tax=Streptomyces daliensis TaxID=299421 RepID=A0A8T4IPL0_9ACTN|nr:hypothetical protein [Streptomyces daliensis]